MNIEKLEREEAAADKVWKEVYGDPETDGAPAKTDDGTPGDTGITPDPAEGKPPDEKKPDPVVPDAQPKPPTDVDWKHKYDTLEGKYRAEVPRLSSDVKQWRENAVALSQRVTELEGKLSETVAKTTVAETDQELDALEKDYPDIGKAIKKLKEAHKLEMEELTKKFQTGLTEELQPVKSDLSENKQGRFDAEMARLGVADWKTVDTQPEFHAWLNEPAPYGRYTKMELLQDAARALDAGKVSKFFLDFKAQKPAAPVGEEPVVDQQGRLEKFVAPPKNEIGGKPKVGTKTLTRDMYVDFMRNSAKGNFNPAKWGGKTEAQVEAMFDAAIAAKELA